MTSAPKTNTNQSPSCLFRGGFCVFVALRSAPDEFRSGFSPKLRVSCAVSGNLKSRRSSGRTCVRHITAYIQTGQTG